MNEQLKYFSMIGTVLIIILGTLLHFTYEWSGNNTLVGIFAPINESVWEHLKLLFWPSFLFSILEYFVIGKNFENYIPAKVISFYIGIFLIIILFYTYTGITGKDNLITDIAIFIISVIISQYIAYKLINSSVNFGVNGDRIAIIALVFLIFTFITFTFNPPKAPLFQDPVTGSYGINRIV